RGVGPDQALPAAVLSLRRNEVAAVPDELALDLFDDRRVDHDRVLRRTQHAVVERLAGDDVALCLYDVGGALEERGRVAGPDAVRRLAGAIGRAHQPHAAGGEDDGGLARLHQLLRPFQRHRRHAADRAFGSAGPAGRFPHDPRDARDAADRRGMRADHDGAARLQRDEDLVDRRGRRVRRRDDGADDAERLRDLDDLAILEAADDADRLHRTDELVALLGGEEVLLDLVGDDAVAG